MHISQRFAVMLFRTQAVESPAAPPARPAVASGRPAPAQNSDGNAATPNTNEDPPFSITQVIRDEFNRYPSLKCKCRLLSTLPVHAHTRPCPGILPLVGLVIVLALLDMLQVTHSAPYLTAMLYSWWLPQIWRNARKGTRKALNWRFVIGMSICRCLFPLCGPYHRNVTSIPV